MQGKMNTFAAKRKAAGLRQEDVAEVLGVNRSTLAMWETNRTLPTSDKLPALAKLYGCTVDDLLKDIVTEG